MLPPQALGGISACHATTAAYVGRAVNVCGTDPPDVGSVIRCPPRSSARALEPPQTNPEGRSKDDFQKKSYLHRTAGRDRADCVGPDGVRKQRWRRHRVATAVEDDERAREDCDDPGWE